MVLNHSHTREWTHNLDTCSAILVTGSDLLKQWRTHSLKVFSHSCQWFWSAHIGEWLTTYMHLVVQISGSDLLKQMRATHFLNFFFFNYHVSQIHVHLLQSYRFVLSEKSCQIFNNMHQEMPLTYCQHSISLIFIGFQQDIAHILKKNHMSISISRDYDDNWSYIALLPINFHWHSSIKNINWWWFSNHMHLQIECWHSLVTIPYRVNT